MLTQIKALFGNKSNQQPNNVFIEAGELKFHLSRAKILLAEMKVTFSLYHIVEVFWITSDILDIVQVQNTTTKNQQFLIQSLSNWSRDKHGFNRTEDNQSITSNTVFIGGDLGVITGLVTHESLWGLNTYSIEYYADSTSCEHMERVYKILFIEVLSQIIDQLVLIKNELQIL